LLQAEKELALLNGMEQGVVTLVVRGADTEEILQRQEKLGAELREAGVPFYTSASAIVPSAARQKENFELVKNLVAAYAEDVPVEMPDTWPGPLLPEHLLRADSPFVSLGSLWGEGCGLVLVPGNMSRSLNRCLSIRGWSRLIVLQSFRIRCGSGACSSWCSWALYWPLCSLSSLLVSG
jgi:hypothetical protein